MYVSHWLFPISVLGPGNRLGIWTQGCNRNCKGCIAPELQSKGLVDYNVAQLAYLFNEIVRRNELTGVTISGGEPLEQLNDLIILTELLECKDVLLYTGYDLDEIKEILPKLKVGVIISGPYIQNLDANNPLYGSSNQEISFINPELKDSYLQYISHNERKQELFIIDDFLYTAGLAPNFIGENQKELIKKSAEEGANGDQGNTIVAKELSNL